MVNSLIKNLDADNLPSINYDDMAGALYDAADDATTGSNSGSVDFLSFNGKTGRYNLGRDKEDIDPDQLYLVGPHTFTNGWVCWKDLKRADSVAWSIFEADKKAVAREDLVDHGPYRGESDGWNQELTFGVVGCDEHFSQVKFSSNSKSGRNSVGDLMKEIGARSAAQEPNMPLIYFHETEFVNRRGEKNFKPVFKVETWVSRDSVAAYKNGKMTKDQLIAGDAPKKKKRKAASRKKK